MGLLSTAVWRRLKESSILMPFKYFVPISSFAYENLDISSTYQPFHHASKTCRKGSDLPLLNEHLQHAVNRKEKLSAFNILLSALLKAESISERGFEFWILDNGCVHFHLKKVL